MATSASISCLPHRSSDDDDVAQAHNMNRQCGDIEGLRDSIEHRLRQIAKAIASQPVPRNGENARLQRVAPGIVQAFTKSRTNF